MFYYRPLEGVVLIDVFQKPEIFAQLCAVRFAGVIEAFFVIVLSGFELTLSQTLKLLLLLHVNAGTQKFNFLLHCEFIITLLYFMNLF